MNLNEAESLEKVGTLIDQGDAEALKNFVESLPSDEVVRLFNRLGGDRNVSVIEQLDADSAAAVLEDLPESQAARIVNQLSVEEAADIVEELSEVAQSEVLRELDSKTSQAILDEMEPTESEGLRGRIEYPADTAGALMTENYLAFSGEDTVGAVLEDLEKHADRYADFNVQYIYVISADGRLIGVLRLRDMLLAKRSKGILEMMIANPVSVSARTSLDKLGRMFDQHAFLGIPVLDHNFKLTGVLLRSTVLDARAKRARRTFLKLSGIIGGEELRSSPVRTRSLRRLAFLAPNIVLNLIAASVIALYQETLQAVIVLAVFLPIISDMSGCSGNQAVAVSIRELALGVIGPRDFWRIIWKEGSVGIFNGIVLGVILGGIAALWKDNLVLGLVVGGALAVNTILAMLLGGLIPVMLRAMRLDPALASAPILTTVTDMCGFFLVLNFATLTLSHLS